jgi:cytochrome oxidase Cu insertion factor (SCO1/SenC/PrrC family)
VRKRSAPYRRVYNVAMSLAGMVRFVLGSFRGGRMLKVGDEAPDFEVNDHRGRKVALRDLRGRKVVLWFYPKADTPG